MEQPGLKRCLIQLVTSSQPTAPAGTCNYNQLYAIIKNQELGHASAYRLRDCLRVAKLVPLWQAWSCHHSVGPEQAPIQNGQRNLASRRVQASLSVSTERSTAQMVKETVQPGPSKTRKFATCFASFTSSFRILFDLVV